MICQQIEKEGGKKVCLLVKMGGNGVRVGAEIPKQFMELKGKPLFYWLLKQYESLGMIDGYFLVSHPDWMQYTKDIAGQLLRDKVWGVIPGGNTMSKSIYNGIMYARDFMSDEDVLLVHDVTNPVVATNQIPNVVSDAREYDFCVLTTEQVHTIYHIDSDNNIEYVIPKQEVSSGYSPEGFLFGRIYECYKKSNVDELEHMTSAIALAKGHGARIKAIKSHIINLKITYKEDLDAYERIIEGEGMEL